MSGYSSFFSLFFVLTELATEIMASKSKQLQLFQKHVSNIGRIAHLVDVIRLVMLGAFIATEQSFVGIFCPLIIFIVVLSIAIPFSSLLRGTVTDNSGQCCGRDVGKGQRATMFGMEPSI